MRKRLFEIIESAHDGDKASRVYDLILIFTIVISLFPLCTKQNTEVIRLIDIGTVIVFIGDYCLRFITSDLRYPDKKGGWAFARYVFSFMGIVDLLSILPSFGIFNDGMKVLKIFRLFRSLKVLKALKALKAVRAVKLLRYSHSVQIIIDVMKAQKEALFTVAGLAAGYIFLSSLVIFNVEPDSFQTFFDAVYWACISLTTVGYGDIYPITTAGRIVTMISSVMGIAIVALPSGIITAGYMNIIQQEKSKQQKRTDLPDHADP